MGAERFFSHQIDERVAAVSVTSDALIVKLFDGRMISAPLEWFPELAEADPAHRKNWEPAEEGFGIHWPEIDIGLNVRRLLRPGS
jgi:hypothetical protein